MEKGEMSVLGLVANEFRKIYKNRGFVAVFMILFACNLLAACMDIVLPEQKGHTPLEEQELFAAMESMDQEQRLAYLSECLEEARESCGRLLELGSFDEEELRGLWNRIRFYEQKYETETAAASYAVLLHEWIHPQADLSMSSLYVTISEDALDHYESIDDLEGG